MSDIMKSIPFGQLTEWILNEYKKTGQVFGIQKAYVADQSKTIEIFGRKLENPVVTGSRSAYTACTESCGCICRRCQIF